MTVDIIRSGLPVIDGSYPVPGGTNPDVTLFYLQQQPSSPPANAVWSNTFGVLAHGKVTAVQNQNPFAVELITDGHSNADCFKGSSATVVLGPKATTTAAQLAQVFSQGTNFPRPMLACAYAGGTPPQLLAFTVTYQPQP